ncbi:MAG: hypothetical protein GAK33_03495 [Burkholderia lata]|uniref:Tyr recombinase domain-containing protein n=1 Tax=Burkholderia lata (strain ATCC 17760 / DSM 23089 / LMG 22485 / NCIMB 9086 / R18194 / 383) TaxID=482957 RepID=A0A833PRD7_BURL3|nr:tyrosine-type recombinase/integrase [Burkholderia lata]KAF1037011.1 MAG: hypothetical protein GAK33_03495 [Burkholderia lata]
MFESVVIERTRYTWVLAVDALHDGKRPKIDWRTFLPRSGGSKHQREYLLCSLRGLFVALIEAPRQLRSDRLSHDTVFNWYYALRRMIRWMTARNIWRFSSLSRQDVAEYIEYCDMRDDRKGSVSRHTFYFRLQLLNEMWEFRGGYLGALRVNPATIDVDAIRKSKPEKSSWRALDEDVAIPLIGDAITFIRSHGAYLASVRKRRWQLDRGAVGIEKWAKAVRVNKLYKALGDEPGLELLRDELNMRHEHAHVVLRRAFALADGACFILILFTEGMRVSELVRLDIGCLKPGSLADGTTVNRLHGIAAKKGAKRRSWIATDEVAEAIDYLDESFSGQRRAFGLKALILNKARGGSGATAGSRPRRARRGIVATRMKLFAKAPERRVQVNQRIHPHVARKTFARFVVCRDKHALEALAYHFGHIYQSVTDGSYVGSDIELQKLLSEESRRDLECALTDLINSPNVSGKAGAAFSAIREGTRSNFRGKRGVRRLVEKLIADGVQLAPCYWGYCVYSQALSACHGDSRGPNEARRSPDVCAGCQNFAVTERHRPWWEARLDREDQFLATPDLPTQTIAVVSRRRSNSACILSDLNKDKWMLRSDV